MSKKAVARKAAARGRKSPRKRFLPAVLFEPDPAPKPTPRPTLRTRRVETPVAPTSSRTAKAVAQHRPPLIPLGIAETVLPTPSGAPETPPPASGKPEGLVLRLLARDPNCVFAFWEVPPGSVQRVAEAASAGRIRLRLHSTKPARTVLREEPVLPDARSRFLEVDPGISECVADLVWVRSDDAWETLAESAPIRLPLARPAPTAVAPAAPPPPPAEAAETRVEPEKPPAAQGARPADSPASPRPENVPSAAPTDPAPAAEGEVAPASPTRPEPVAEAYRPQRPSGPEIAEAVALAMQLGIPPESFAGGPGTPTSPEAGGLIGPGIPPGVGLLPTSADVAAWGGPVSSGALPGALPGSLPEAAAAAKGGFWFNVNAELIVYGATLPDARLTVDGQPMALRPDGTFTLRFALPDGDYRLELQATADDDSEERTARLKFVRATRRGGRVGIHPQAEALSPPRQDEVQPG